MNHIILQINSGKTSDIDPEAIKEFIIESSYVINKKIMDLETQYNVNIKLKPLSKRIPVVRKSSGAIVPTMGVAHINTGMKGTIMYPTQLNVSPLIAYGPFLLDPINGMGGENYKERLIKINQYLKVYRTVKPQLEAWVAATTDAEKAAAKAKINSRYVEFLPGEINLSTAETDMDLDTIEDWLSTFYNKPGKSTPTSKTTPAKPSTPTQEEQIDKIVKDVEAVVVGIEELVKKINDKALTDPTEIASTKKNILEIANETKTKLTSKIEELKKLIKENPTSDAKIEEENISINSLIAKLDGINVPLTDSIEQLSSLKGGSRSNYSRYYR